MSTAYQFYISSLLIYFGVNVLACWGLNLQIGVTGIINFAFVLFQAAGAYTAAVLTLGPVISPPRTAASRATSAAPLSRSRSHCWRPPWWGRSSHW